MFRLTLGQPEHRHPDRQRHQAGRRDAGGQRGREGPAGLGAQEGRGVGADAEEGGVGQGEAADVAHDQVVAQREGPVERGEDQHVQDVALLTGRHRRDDPRDRDEERPPEAPAQGAHRQIPIRRPNSPCGRTSNTATMTTNAIASL